MAAAVPMDLFYVSKTGFEHLLTLLLEGEEIPEAAVLDLFDPDKWAPDTVMIPVDVSGCGQNMDFDDIEGLVRQIGPKGAAEALVKAHEHFHSNPNNVPDEDLPMPMTAAEWFAHLNRPGLAGDSGGIALPPTVGKSGIQRMRPAIAVR